MSRVLPLYRSLKAGTTDSPPTPISRYPDAANGLAFVINMDRIGKGLFIATGAYRA